MRFCNTICVTRPETWFFSLDFVSSVYNYLYANKSSISRGHHDKTLLRDYSRTEAQIKSLSRRAFRERKKVDKQGDGEKRGDVSRLGFEK